MIYYYSLLILKKHVQGLMSKILLGVIQLIHF